VTQDAYEPNIYPYGPDDPDCAYGYPNDSRESIKNYIPEFYLRHPDTDLCLKRHSSFREEQPSLSTAVVMRDAAADPGIMLRVIGGDVLTYSSLGAMIDDGWLIN
jgi:hypothetical protein